MRRRILTSTLLLIAAALIAFAVPLALAVRGLLTERALEALAGETEQAAAILDQQVRTCGQVELFVAVVGQGDLDLSVHTRDGRVAFTEPGFEPADVDIVRTATTSVAARAYAGEHLVAARLLDTRVCAAPLILRTERSDDALASSVRTAWLVIGAFGAAVLAVAAAAATVQGRRLARPFEALAGSARALGEGDFTRRAPRSGLPEADAIAEALDLTADRLGRSVQRGQAFAADAGHQLRTPLTALRLQLEMLEPHDPVTTAAALAEADRLEETISELVALTTLDRPDVDLDLGAFVEGRLEVWRDLATAVGRDVAVEVLPVPAVRVRPAALGQALQVLLDNALEHGAGTVTLRVSPTLPTEGADDRSTGVRVTVADEGPGIDPDVVAARTAADRGGGPLPISGGRGLRLARSLIEAEGGRLTVESTGTGTVAIIVLPGSAG